MSNEKEKDQKPKPVRPLVLPTDTWEIRNDQETESTHFQEIVRPKPKSKR